MASLDERIKHASGEKLDLSNASIQRLESVLPHISSIMIHELDVSGNQLTELPKNISSLQHLHTLNIANNPFSGVGSILDGLRSLPALRVLNASFTDAAEELIMRRALPHLEKLNGADPQSTHEEIGGVWNIGRGSPPADVRTTAPLPCMWGDEATKAIEHLYADVVVGRDGTPRSDPRSEDFFDYLNRVVQHVSCLTTTERDDLTQQGEVLKARRLLVEYCVRHWGNSLMKQDASLEDGFLAVMSNLNELLDQYDYHWRCLVADRSQRVKYLTAYMEEAKSELESLLRGSKDGAVRPGGLRRSTDRLALGVSPSPQSARSRSSRQRSSHPGTGSCTRSDGYRLPSRNSVRPSTSVPYEKTLSLKQLKDVMDEIYMSKSKYDEQCAANKLPRETMEQHMYTYLNQRYGLREIIAEWATAIVKAVKRFALDDNDVAVFAKILRNEIEEEFRLVQMRLRQTAHELLRQQMRRSYPLKGSAELNVLVQRKVAGSVKMAEWLEIVEFMYNEEDARSISSLIQRELYRRTRATRRGSDTPSEVAVPFSDILRYLLDYQLNGHENFLKPYVQLFRRFDTDQDGILSGVEAGRVVRSLCPHLSTTDVNALVGQMDPVGSQMISFSDSVKVLNDDIASLHARS